MRSVLGSMLAWTVITSTVARGGNFSTRDEDAVKFGVHEIVLRGDGAARNPFDTMAAVTFTPDSGARRARRVQAFYDGGDVWRARVHVDEAGPWRWESTSDADASLNGRSGRFNARESPLHGRLLSHPRNPRQWITEDGRYFLNLSDTAYFLLCRFDGNGDPVTDDDARRYIDDDARLGVTALRCFLTERDHGAARTANPWEEWFFRDRTHDQFRLDKLQHADRRLRMLLDLQPDMAVQLILFPLDGYARDDRFWTAMTAPQRERLLRHLVARYAAFPQIMWLITNDAHYGRDFPRNNAMVREVGAFLQTHDPWGHPRSTGHARGLPFVFGAEEWATYVHIEDQHDLGASKYARYHDLAKPVFLGEDRYEQDHGPRLDPLHMRYWQRRLFWAWLLSGGSANYGGRWWTVRPYSETGTRSTSCPERPHAIFRDQLTGLDSARPIRDFFERRDIDLGDFEPDHDRARDDDGGTGVRSPQCMRRGMEEFLIYHPHAAADGQAAQVEPAKPARLGVDLRNAPGAFSVEWYRADDGTTHDGGMLKGGERRELTAPWIGADVVVRLTRK